MTGGYWAGYPQSIRTDGTAILEIDAGKFANAGGGRVMLLEANSASFATIDAMVNSAVWVSGSGSFSYEFFDCTKMRPNPDGGTVAEIPFIPYTYYGMQLIVNVDNKAGTKILLR